MKLPVGVSGLLKILDAHGWAHQVTHGTGTVEAQILGDPRGDGTRPKVKIDAPCESIAIRAAHVATGRAVRALFVCRTDKPKRAWTMSTAWRGAHPDRTCTGCATGGCGNGDTNPCTSCLEGGCGQREHAPRQLTTTELRAYLAEEPDEDPQ